MIVFLIVLIIIGLILFIPIKVKATYLLYRDTNRILVRGGLFTEFITLYDSTKPKKEIDLEVVLALLKETLNEFVFFKKRLTFDNLKLHFHIGFEDAAYCGITTGLTWSALYNILSLVDHNFKLKKHSLHICPEFNKKVFETDIELRVSIRIIFLLIFAYKAYKSIKKLSIDRKED